MYEASKLFKEAISRQNRELRIRVTIDGQQYSGTDVQYCSIEESILTGEDFKFGSATAATFDLTLLNMDDSLSAKNFEGKYVHIEMGAVLEKFKRPIEYVSMGTYIIEKGSKENNLIKLSGFDKMILFEKPYISTLSYPATLKQILQEICTLAGVPLKSTSFINDNYVVRNKPDFEGVSLRIALEYISELACGFTRINRNGQLEIATLTNTSLSIDRSNYYSMNLSEYEYGPINYVAINNEGIVEDIGSGSNILEIKDNIFSFNPNNQLLLNIYNHVKSFKFKPFTTTWQGNVLTAPGDKVKASYKNSETYSSFIAKQKFIFDNGLSCEIATNAKTKMQIDFETKGIVTAEMGKVKSSIKNLGNEIRLEVEEVEKSVATLSVKADNIQLGVTELNGRMGNAESQLSIQAGQIQSKVSYSEYNGPTVTSMITQDPYSITQMAQNLNMQGLVMFTNLNTPGQSVIDGGNIYGQRFVVGNGTGSTLTMTSIAGSHSIHSVDAAGFRVSSNGSLSLASNSGNGVYATGGPLVAQSGFRVDGGTSQFNTNVTVNATHNASALQVQGAPVATQTWVAQLISGLVTTSELNAALALKESQIVAWANNKFVAK